MKRRILYILAFGIGIAFVVAPSKAARAEDFYKGKTIRFIVGFSPGGAFPKRPSVAACSATSPS